MWRKWFQRATPSTGSIRHARPRLERLEDRLAPALVSIDPGLFVGDYALTGTGFIQGPSNANLAAGTYTMHFRNDSFQFDVDADGNVTSRNQGAALGVGNSLVFNSVSIQVDSGAYTGGYRPGFAGAREGPATLAVVANLGNYQVGVGGSSGFTFDVDSNGQITSDNGAAAHGDGSILVFHTSTIRVDPGAYSGTWRPGEITFGQDGVQILTLVPGLSNYPMGVGGSSGFTYNVDANGIITSNNAAAASGSGTSLLFHTSILHVDPGAFVGTWRPGEITFGQDGIQDLVLVPGLSNDPMRVGRSTGFTYDVAPDGSVTSNNPAAAFGAGNSLFFHTSVLHVDPGAFTGTWRPGEISFGQDGIQDLILVPGLNNYPMGVGRAPGFTFDIANDGTVSSDNPDAATGVGNGLFFRTTVIRAPTLASGDQVK
ncbi:MAG: hypothetical protein HYX68_22160 [Planctomycetes bacterium]|nr:hypothetical protein [Planctomycetota bacterium]